MGNIEKYEIAQNPRNSGDFLCRFLADFSRGKSAFFLPTESGKSGKSGKLPKSAELIESKVD